MKLNLNLWCGKTGDVSSSGKQRESRFSPRLPNSLLCPSLRRLFCTMEGCWFHSGRVKIGVGEVKKSSTPVALVAGVVAVVNSFHVENH